MIKIYSIKLSTLILSISCFFFKHPPKKFWIRPWSMRAHTIHKYCCDKNLLAFVTRYCCCWSLRICALTGLRSSLLDKKIYITEKQRIPYYNRLEIQNNLLLRVRVYIIRSWGSRRAFRRTTRLNYIFE